MENQHPLKQKRDSPAGCLTRVYWMIVGNALLFVCAITIARGSSNSFTQIDTLFWILVGSLLTARYVDIRYFNGTTGDGNTATMADFKRYAVLLGFIAIGLWIGVHVFGAFHVDALSSAPEQFGTLAEYNALKRDVYPTPSCGTRAGDFRAAFDRACRLRASAPDSARGDELGLDGYCPVTLQHEQRWIVGDRRWGAIHEGRTYLFMGPTQQQQFLSNPNLYSPVLAGADPVLALESGQNVPGSRRHGVVYDSHVFLFSSEATLQRFTQDPDRFAQGVHQAMKRNSSQLPPR